MKVKLHFVQCNVKLVEGKDPESVFNILFDYFYLQIKISFAQTCAVIKFNRVCDCT